MRAADVVAVSWRETWACRGVAAVAVLKLERVAGCCRWWYMNVSDRKKCRERGRTCGSWKFECGRNAVVDVMA